MTLGILKPEQIGTARELKALYTNLEIHCVLIPEEKFAELFEVLYNRALAGMRGTDRGRGTKKTGKKSPSISCRSSSTRTSTGKRMRRRFITSRILRSRNWSTSSSSTASATAQATFTSNKTASGVKLRYRIDGVLRDCNIAWLRKKIQEKAGSIISRIKIISNLDIAERRIPQDGVFRINYYDKAKGEKTDLDFRVATCKAIVGENVVIRILDSRNATTWA